uniref:Uncharacterized protein n=1 Tax=mine drainage metagenome TaxID=410659 RepID=E6PIU7_9ZZZZ
MDRRTLPAQCIGNINALLTPLAGVVRVSPLRGYWT